MEEKHCSWLDPPNEESTQEKGSEQQRRSLSRGQQTGLWGIRESVEDSKEEGHWMGGRDHVFNPLRVPFLHAESLSLQERAVFSNRQN